MRRPWAVVVLVSAAASLGRAFLPSRFLQTTTRHALLPLPQSAAEANLNGNQDNDRWMSQGMLISSFSDGLLPNTEAHALLLRGVVRAMLTQMQRETEDFISKSAEYSPCAGPNVQALDQLDRLDAALQKLGDDSVDALDVLQTLQQQEQLLQDSSSRSSSPLALRFVYVPTAMYALRSDSTNSPGKQRQRARADGKSRRNDIVQLLQQLLPDVEIHVVTLDWDDGSIKQPEGSPDATAVFPKNASDAMQKWQPHLVYVQGGNTFWLYHCLHKTPHLAHDLLDFCLSNAGFYIGSSAGAILVGAHMQTACWKGWDDPRVVPNMETYDDWKHVQGMSLVGPYSFFPHMDDQWDTLVKEKSRELESVPIICLRDGDVCFVDGVKKTTTLLQAAAWAFASG